ncbi:hypothetical protein [Coleofasciculus sp. F4-SAH-05]|uniref:hypothetical protein n=1 Tax=Coleofasciculus sp. F4-SAH-05 TaxID=3069525 RepID=UPI0032F9E787
MSLVICHSSFVICHLSFVIRPLLPHLPHLPHLPLLPQLPDAPWHVSTLLPQLPKDLRNGGDKSSPFVLM